MNIQILNDGKRKAVEFDGNHLLVNLLVREPVKKDYNREAAYLYNSV